ncbi:MATE family efflux transporter [Vallitalea okinawensis]|uniref:MATE family efflux transporter n=1 Tax=Vallitalea okinawensis TaxID=2078660 RepID=UPI000CFD74DE|nr:MATE family efflux transporter [Vallitalea okinawensis]
MNEDKNKILGEGNVSTSILKLAIPTIIGLLITAIYNFVDTIFVSWAGTDALSAATVGFPIIMLLGGLGSIYGLGGSTYVSRLLGQGDVKRASRAVSTSIITSIITAVGVTLLGLLLLNPLVRLFGATNDSVLLLSRQYVGILIMGSVFTMINITMNNLLRAEGSATFSMVGLSVGAILNIILDPLFIFVFNLGVAGAAIATVLSQIVSTAILISFYIRKKSSLKLSFKYFSPDKVMYAEIYKIGIVSFLVQMLTSVAMGLLNNQAALYGNSEALAAMGIVSRVFMMGFYIMFGYSQGFLPIAGYSYGAKNYDRLLDAIKAASLWITGFCLFLTIIFQFFTEPIVLLFKASESVTKIAVTGLHYYAIFLPVLGIFMVATALYQALGHAGKAAIVSISRQGLFLIPLLFILPQYLGLTGVLIAQPVADGLSIMIALVLFYFSIKEIKNEKLNNIHLEDDILDAESAVHEQ